MRTQVSDGRAFWALGPSSYGDNISATVMQDGGVLLRSFNFDESNNATIMLDPVQVERFGSYVAVDPKRAAEIVAADISERSLQGNSGCAGIVVIMFVYAVIGFVAGALIF